MFRAEGGKEEGFTPGILLHTGLAWGGIGGGEKKREREREKQLKNLKVIIT